MREIYGKHEESKSVLTKRKRKRKTAREFLCEKESKNRPAWKQIIMGDGRRRIMGDVRKESIVGNVREESRALWEM